MLGSLLVGAVLPGLGRSEVPEPPRPLRYVTFNLFHGGPWSVLNGDDRELERRLRIVVAELRTLRADVIGLQEASAGRRRGTVAGRLAKELGFFHVYAPANPRPVEFEWINKGLAFLLGFSEGPAIVSRFPIAAWQAHSLPRCGRLAQSRILLSATLQTPWGDVRAFSTHTLGDPCQTQRVAEIVSEGGHSLPAVLMGDLNAVEASPALAPFNDGAGLVDAFRAANPTLPGPTVWQRIDAPGPTVYRRVDYVFLVPGERFAGRVLSSRMVLNRPSRSENGDVLWPSDHYGVLAELEVVPPSASPVASRFSPSDVR